MERSYFESTREIQEKAEFLEGQLREIEKSMETLERKYYLKEEMSREVFEKFQKQLAREREELAKKLEEQKTLSNPSETFQKALEFCSKLPQIWVCGQFEVKERLQKVLFPEGIYFDKEKQEYRTPKLNSVFGWIMDLSKDTAKNKSANLPISDKLATLVHPKGLLRDPQEGAATMKRKQTHRLRRAIFVFLPRFQASLSAPGKQKTPLSRGLLSASSCTRRDSNP